MKHMIRAQTRDKLSVSLTYQRVQLGRRLGVEQGGSLIHQLVPLIFGQPGLALLQAIPDLGLVLRCKHFVGVARVSADVVVVDAGRLQVVPPHNVGPAITKVKMNRFCM